MTVDISSILSDWPFEPGQVTARRIRGLDGQEKIQLRLDLGILQMEISGRPDGQHPHSQDSLLAYYEQQLQAYKQANGSGSGFKLDEQACELLRNESVMYYHRYLAEFILEDYPAVERDTLRNLRVMDLCANHAEEETDRYAMEQYRPYVLMMCTRARARIALNESRIKTAIAVLQAGIDKIASFHRRFGQGDLIAQSSEISILKAMLGEANARIPVDPLQKLRKDLEKALIEERYEDAAHLRDQIKTARDHKDEPEA